MKTKYPNGITEEQILYELSRPVLIQANHRLVAKRLGIKCYKTVFNWLKKLYKEGKITKNKKNMFCFTGLNTWFPKTFTNIEPSEKSKQQFNDSNKL